MNKHAVIVVGQDMKIEQIVKEIVNLSQKQVILEVPETTTFLTNEINLRLIKFYAEDEEKELIINAVDPLLVALAQRLEISTICERNLDVVRQTEEAAAAAPCIDPESPPPFKKSNSLFRFRPKASHLSKKTRNWSAKGFFPALVVTLATLAIGIWFFVQPQVVVMVYPKEQKLNFGEKVMTGVDYQDKDILDGNIPAKLVEKDSEITIQTVATGKKVVGKTAATGRVILINRSLSPVVVRQGAIVIGNGVRFKTNKTVLVPRKSFKMRYGIPIGEEFGKVQVAVTAQVKGTKGNIKAKKISKIVGPYRKVLQVINLIATTGGKDQTLQVVAPEDVEKGKKEAMSQMYLIAQEELNSLVGEGFLYLPELAKMEVQKFRNVPAVGIEATTVKSHLQYRAYAVVPSTAAIQKYLINCSENNIPPGFEAKNKAVKLVSAQVLKSGPQSIKLHLVGTVALRGILSRQKVKEMVVGKTIEQARENLTRQSEVAEFSIQPRDPKSRKMPRFGFQIKIIFPAEAKRAIVP